MAADTSVKFFHSAMTGAPTLNGTAGQLIGLLDALLVNGYGLGTVDSVVVAGGVATVVRSAGHPFDVGSVALIDGATGGSAGLNGQKKVLSKTTNSYTFDATGIADGAATGTITHKMAPAGFAKLFAGTNKAAYRSADATSTGGVLRIDDTTTQQAQVWMYESMSDIDTGLPATGMASGFWAKSSSADSTARNWVLAADSRMFYLYVAHYSPQPGQYGALSAFGDFQSAKNPDAFACMLHAASSGQFNNSTPGGSQYDFTTGFDASVAGNAYTFAMRSFTGMGSSVFLRRSPIPGDPLNGSSTFASGSTGNNFTVYPNPVDYAIYVSEYNLNEQLSQGKARRGAMVGIYFAAQAIGGSAIAHLSEITGATALPGRKLRSILHANGVSFVDTTGPWR